MKRLSIFFGFLLCAIDFSLFANDVNPHVLFIQDRGKYTGIALSLNMVTDNPDNDILISHGAGINGINPNLVLGYAFNPAHRLTLKLPYYLLYNDKDDVNNIVDIDLAYTYTKKFNDLNFLFGPHIKGTVYHSGESPSTSNYLYNTGKYTLGAAFRLMDHYDLAAEGRLYRMGCRYKIRYKFTAGRDYMAAWRYRSIRGCTLWKCILCQNKNWIIPGAW
ncbi:hypothetical protein AGMMS50267_02950 [Spirochaetia bacterium]|nr:hypothetical protein AGMMS50267_02950 [Spirochaetia bacterium]